jgi:hypothetical protein
MSGGTTYSFLNVSSKLAGPGGAVDLGASAQVSKEGITITFAEDRDKMDVGADGAAMHTLRANRAGTIVVRLLKTSPTNNALTNMANLQFSSAALHGQNTLIVRDAVRGDLYTCTQVAMVRNPNNVYAEDGNMLEWSFNAGQIIPALG